MRSLGRLCPLFTLLASFTLAGCGDDLSLLPAIYPNRVDTLKMYAVDGTPVYRPSAYVISIRSVIRLDQTSTFDFLYDVTPDGEHVFLPLGAVVNTGRTTGNPGFLDAFTPFDSIASAPQTGYISADTVRARVGDVFYVRSAVDANCVLGIPYYAKLQVLGFSDTDRYVYFRILANVNCGYRNLEVGLPKK